MNTRVPTSSLRIAKTLASLAIFTVLLPGCGGGGGSDGDGSSATVLQGSLIQGEDGEAAETSSRIRLAHSAGEGIGEVEVCALGSCSTTDSMGRWGFAVPSTPTAIPFTIVGHGIDQTATVQVPDGAAEVEIEFENHGSEGIHIHSVIADGNSIPQPGEAGDAE